MTTTNWILALTLFPLICDDAPIRFGMKNPLSFEDTMSCPALNNPEIGGVDLTCREPHCTYSVTCPEGYLYTGTTPRVCQQNFTWSGRPGECEAVQCSILSDPRHGRVLQYNRSYLANATIVCDEGYSYSNPEWSVRQCLGNRSWSGTMGHCKAVRCPDIPDVENGNLSQQSGQFGDTILLQCDSGHVTDGPSAITCRANGKWSVRIGRCNKQLQSTNNNTLFIVLGVGLAVAVAVTVGIVKRYHKFCLQGSRHGFGTYPCPPVQSIPVSGSVTGVHKLYCSFTVMDDMKDGFREMDKNVFQSLIKEDIIRRIKRILSIDVDVILTAICISRKTCLFVIMSHKNLDEENVINAISQTDDTTPYRIKPGSITTRERALHFLVADIIQKKHTVDKRLDKSIDLDKQYVRLRLLSQKSWNTMNRDKLERPDRYQLGLQKNKSKDILDEDLIKEGDCQKLILIRGRAGIGKTTLIQRLLWKWANGEWATKFKVMFLLNLRYLMTIDRTMDLSHLLSLYSTYNTGQAGQLIYPDWLKDNQEEVGIMLDGLDEISSFKDHWINHSEIINIEAEARPLEWCFSLMKRNFLERSTVIISSRPFADLRLIEKAAKCETMLVELMGLTRERVMEFAEKNAPDTKEFVKKTLTKNPILMSVCAITFYCAALCQVLGGLGEKAATLSTYTRITSYIMKTYMERSVKAADQQSWNKLYESLRPTMDLLSKLAYDGLLNRPSGELPRLIFDRSDLKKLNVGKDKLHTMRDVGLLMETDVPSPSNPKEATVLSQFVHLSIQEFLAMVGLLSDDLQSIDNSMRKFMKSDHFDMALLFLYGLAFDQDDDIINNMFTLKCEQLEPRELVLQTLLNGVDGLSNEFQAMQLAHESQSKEVAQKVGRKFFREEVSIKGHKMTVIDVIAMIFILKHHTPTHTIRLKHVDLDSASVQEIATFLKSQDNVQTLDLDDNGIDDESVRDLMDEIRPLTALSLSSEKITDVGMTSIATALEHNTRLLQFSFASESVSSAGLAKVTGALMKNDSLQELTLTSDGLTDETLANVVSVLNRNPALSQLSLSSDEVTDDGIEIMVKALGPNTHLKNLSVESHKLSDKSVKHFLAAATQTSALIELKLYGFHMGDEGAESVLQLLDVQRNLSLRMWPPRCCEQLKNKLDRHVRFDTD